MMRLISVLLAATALLVAGPAYAEGTARAKGKIAAAAPAASSDQIAFATGCAIGGMVGHAAINVAAADANTATFGVAADCLMVITGSKLAIGVMGDVVVPGSDLKSLGTNPPDYSWFVGFRGGLLVSDSFLVYALAGRTDWDGADKGMTYGAGAETLITKHISIKGEVRRVDMGDADATELRLGANWRF